MKVVPKCSTVQQLSIVTDQSQSHTHPKMRQSYTKVAFQPQLKIKIYIHSLKLLMPFLKKVILCLDLFIFFKIHGKSELPRLVTDLLYADWQEIILTLLARNVQLYRHKIITFLQKIKWQDGEALKKRLLKRASQYWHIVTCPPVLYLLHKSKVHWIWQKQKLYKTTCQLLGSHAIQLLQSGWRRFQKSQKIGLIQKCSSRYKSTFWFSL